MLLASAGPGAYGFSAVALKPVAAVNAVLTRTRNITIGIGLAAVVVICLLLLASIHAMIRPLEALEGIMRRVGQGEFSEHAALEGSTEMVGLSEDVNSMVVSISELIDRTYMASLNERTAQLAALEAQTNPHFLFNTLQAIATEAILAEDEKVYRMITTLASLLRYTIRGGNLTDLKTELAYVGKYLTLQKATAYPSWGCWRWWRTPSCTAYRVMSRASTCPSAAKPAATWPTSAWRTTARGYPKPSSSS